jgi:uncharacterized membrane protein
MNYFKKLIANNTGVSSKNFFLIVVTFIGCLLLLVPVFALSIEAFFMHTIATDLSAMAAYIGAVASLFAMAGITKAWSEKYECKNQQTLIGEETEQENETEDLNVEE